MRLAKHVKPEVQLPLKDIHKEKRMALPKNILNLILNTCYSPMNASKHWMDPTDGARYGSPMELSVLIVFAANRVAEA